MQEVIRGCTPDEAAALYSLTPAQIAGTAPRPDHAIVSRADLIAVVIDMFVVAEPTAIRKIAHLVDEGIFGKMRINDAGKSIIMYWITDKGTAVMDKAAIPRGDE